MAYDNEQNAGHEGEGQPLPYPPIAIPSRDSLAAQIAHLFAYHDPANAALVAQMTLEGLDEVYDDPAEFQADQEFYWVMDRAYEDAADQHVRERTQAAMFEWDQLSPADQELIISVSLKSAD